MNIVNVKNEQETIELGKGFAKKLKPGDVVFLFGDLGFGKTTFVKGIAEGLGVNTRIISPTFTVVRKHKNLYHVDLYRIEEKRQLIELGIEELFDDKSSIKLIEWPEILSMQPDWEVRFELEDEQNTRSIKFTQHE